MSRFALLQKLNLSNILPVELKLCVREVDKFTLVP